MGEVYRATDTRPAMARDVAIKVLRHTASVADRVDRFEQEARAISALNHPNIVGLYDVGTVSTDGASTACLYIVMKLVDGMSLREQLLAGPIGFRKSIEYARQISHGLAAAPANESDRMSAR